MGGKLNIIIVSSLFLLYPIYNVYSVRKEVLYFLFIFCVEVQQWNSFSCMFLWLFFSIISRLVFLPSPISSFMRHKNWSNSKVRKQKISQKMKRFDDWGSYSNNTFKVYWKNVHHNTEILDPRWYKVEKIKNIFIIWRPWIDRNVLQKFCFYPVKQKKVRQRSVW